jgi:hypothetical protein
MQVLPLTSQVQTGARPVVEMADELVALLDDHHVVALSNSNDSRDSLSTQLARALMLLGDTQVMVIDGSAMDLHSFCLALESQMHPLGGHAPDGAWRDLAHLHGMLRRAGRGCKRLYCIWNQAHEMLKRNRNLFAQIVNSFYSIAAEQEHISLDRLVLQRLVCIGDQSLEDFAQDQHSPFQRWLQSEGHTPFWEVASVLDCPPVVVCRVDE